jgi:hypothetical protein
MSSMPPTMMEEFTVLGPLETFQIDFVLFCLLDQAHNIFYIIEEIVQPKMSLNIERFGDLEQDNIRLHILTQSCNNKEDHFIYRKIVLFSFE